ncbi:interleukin-17 receptor B isoform X3 [Conger conger]|uniref:interleukin-17 receptor B isoform X3 n=1 Tax=Conger conger TaxID=82655 RepID=UPI002A59D5DF|nr:interleukin-17 receptor B isoform X3 [Conger conger]
MKSLLLIVLFKLTTTYGSINVSCAETDEWPALPKETPSVLAKLTVSLAVMSEKASDAALNISWAINIDYSNKYLIGTEFIVNSKSYLCQYYPPFSEVNASGYEQWFHYTEIPAMPDTNYAVIGSNLPQSMSVERPQSKIFETPDCSHETMRQHSSCLRIAEIEIKCSEYISEDKAFSEGKSRWTRILNATGPCDSLLILISPFFNHCDVFCQEKIAPVDCSQREHPNYTLLLCLACITMVLIPVAFLIWYKTYKAHSELPQASAFVYVLVVYPAGNRAFQRAVVAFAEFLQSQLNCKVAIDMWEQGRMAEQGPVRWLTTHTECADKVAIVCTPRTALRENTAEHCQPTALRDHTVPASTDDVFSLALNMLEGQMKGLSALKKYCTVHLGDRPDTKHLPAALRVCKSFSLMKDVEKLGRHLQNTGTEAHYFPSVGLKPRALTGDAAGRLKNAIRELQTG